MQNKKSLFQAFPIKGTLTNNMYLQKKIPKEHKFARKRLAHEHYRY